jgi:metal-responsive CopG/Arc/MetJ family transcriptional regulator
MSRINRPIVIYLPQELVKALDEAAHIQGSSRSCYVKERLLEYFSNGDTETRLKLLGDKK